jgi:dUTP pyrophosphatase
MKVRCTIEDSALMPAYATPGAAGMDLCASKQTYIFTQSPTIVPTGIKLEIPEGYEAQIRPRSGLAAKYGVTVLNTPGTIDSDYRGELKVILFKHSTGTLVLQPGDRIAQLVFAPVTRVTLQPVQELSDTARGTGGLGSTGAKRLTRKPDQP